jgi:hypothetical protein
VHAKLAANAAYRAEYVSLWETQRRTPISLPFVEDLESGGKEDPAGVPGGGRGAPRGRGGRQQQQQGGGSAGAAGRGGGSGEAGKRRAEQVIAAVLEEAKVEVARERAAAAAVAPKAPSEEASPAEVDGGIGGSEAPKPAPKAASKPRSNAVVAAMLAAAAAQDLPELPDNFELPALARAEEPSGEEAKNAQRALNRHLQAEAQRRKTKREQEKVKRRARAAAAVQQQGGGGARAGGDWSTGPSSGAPSVAEDVAAAPCGEAGSAEAASDARLHSTLKPSAPQLPTKMPLPLAKVCRVAICGEAPWKAGPLMPSPSACYPEGTRAPLLA